MSVFADYLFVCNDLRPPKILFFFPSKEPPQIDISFVCIVKDIVNVVILILLFTKDLMIWYLMLLKHYFFKSWSTWRKGYWCELRFWHFYFRNSGLNFVLFLLWTWCLRDVFELLSRQDLNLWDFMTLIVHVCEDRWIFISIVILKSKTHEDFGEIPVLFFHFLVMRSALFSLSCLYEIGHGFKDPVSSSEMFVKEVLMM